MTEPCEDLANAIVMQAVKDWRKAVRTLKKRPRYEAAKQMRDDCEQFFQSDWFETLTSVDGSIILRKLRKEENILDE